MFAVVAVAADAAAADAAAADAAADVLLLLAVSHLAVVLNR